MEPLMPSYPLAKKRQLTNQKQDVIAYESGKEKNAPLDNGDLVVAHDLLVQGAVTNNAVPAGTVRPDQPWDLIENFRTNGPGGDVINCSGLALRVLDCLRSARVNPVNDITQTEANNAGATNAFSGRVMVHYNEPKVQPTHHGLLPTANFTAEGTFRHFVKWASGVGGLIDGSNATFGTAPSVTVGKKVVMVERVAPSGYGAHIVRSRIETDTVRSANPAKKFALNRNQYLHYIVLIMRQGSTRLCSDSVLQAGSYIRVKIGNVPIFERTVEQLRAMQPGLFPAGMPSDFFNGKLVIPFVLDEQDAAGMAVNTAGEFLPDNQEPLLELAPTATATNELEIVEVGREDDAVAAARWGLPPPPDAV